MSTGIPYEVGVAMLKWVYTDSIEIKSDDSFVLELMKASGKFKLDELRDR